MSSNPPIFKGGQFKSGQKDGTGSLKYKKVLDKYKTHCLINVKK